MQLKLDKKAVCLDLCNLTSYKEKKNIIELLTRNGANVSFILNKRISLLIKNDQRTTDSYKCRTAFKLGIPVIHISFIYDYLKNDQVNYNDYLILNSENENSFKQGKILKSW